VGADAGDMVDGGADTDTLRLSASYTPSADANLENVENVTVTGNSSAVVVNLLNQAGEGFNVTLSTYGDTVTTADGVDTITGGTGADVIDAGLGNDTIMAGAGNDTIRGGSGDDVINAGSGDDLFLYVDNNDTIDGGVGNDTLTLSQNYAPVSDGHLSGIERVTLNGLLTAFVDLSNQLGEDFRVTLSNNGDTIFTSDARDTITGGSGNDVIRAGGGDDSIDGGAGSDTADYSDKAAAVVVTLNGGTATTVSVGGIAEDTIINIENLTGGAGNDILTGDTANNILSGLNGDDTIVGDLGDDTITGAGGNDSINAGGGADDIIGADAGDTIDGGADTDTLRLTGSYTPTADVNLENVENVTVTGNSSAVAVDLSNQAGEGFNVTLSNLRHGDDGRWCRHHHRWHGRGRDRRRRWC